jgi:protein ImuB
MGVRTIGQALRLPRAGFARRFGTEQLATLDRLTGRSADLRDRFHARERFRRRRELTYELENHDALLASLAPLFTDLGKFLEARQCAVMELECLLQHRHAPPTSCMLRLAAPAADIRRLTELLGERLSALTLPESVRTCELRSGSLVPRVLSSNHLWQPGEHGGGAGAEASELIERLRARLGPEAVYGLQVLPAHRPEKAWGATEPPGVAGRKSAYRGRARASHAAAPWLAFRRPTWLLPAPQLLSEREGMPRRRGPLRFLSEPERIESGWWDGREIARDYYTAVDIHGVRLWVFRERVAPHRWFLHGVFG